MGASCSKVATYSAIVQQGCVVPVAAQGWFANLASRRVDEEHVPVVATGNNYCVFCALRRNTSDAIIAGADLESR